MDAGVFIRIDDGSTDELRQLRTWLLSESGMQGRVTPIERPPATGELGPVLEALHVLMPSSAVASVLIAWLKLQRSSLKVTVSNGRAKKIAIEARNIQKLDATGLAELTKQLADLDRDEPPGNGSVE